MTPPRRVLFVCLHGSAKSLIALEHFRRLAAERGIAVEAAAAGTAPDAEIPPHVGQGVLGHSIDVRARRPRQVTVADLETASLAVTFACDLGDLAPPGLSLERWDDVPAVSEDFKKARDIIAARLPRLLDE